MKLDEVCYDQNGLVPAIIQDVEDGAVLMLAWMNPEALRLTFETGRVHFWSRSRKRLWLKGETSGNFLFLKKARLDCDRDTLLIAVQPAGPACHTGARTCFDPAPQEDSDGN
ncbi:MAG: phosphoribosyl-AMP cyclohydrolase [Anaerolineaceae bacterium]|nr:phosphoribosyl-AMP cyclohydrolase [Anaerolineaceae bacterium]